MNRLPAFAFALAATAAFGYASDNDDVVVVSATLEAGKFHEECARLQAGQKRSYSWRSSAPVDFNIHYHGDSEVLYPVKRDAMRGDGGTFTAKIGQDYCWMWTARNAPAKIDGRIEAK
jgi:hypothetical protein